MLPCSFWQGSERRSGRGLSFLPLTIIISSRSSMIIIRILNARRQGTLMESTARENNLRPVHLLRVSLLGVLESNFPGDPLQNSTDMRIPTPYN